MSREFDYDLVCIGSGPAGQRAAVQAAKLGQRAAVVEKKHIVGGVCVDTGTIPSKTFREAVIYFSTLAQRFRDEPACFPDGKVDAQALLKRVIDVVQSEVQVVENQLNRNLVAMIQGTAQFTDPHHLRITSDSGERTVSARNILIAVGTWPIMPKGFEADGEVVITSDDVVKLERLPQRMVVVGGGVIGIEYASMFAALDIEVILIDRAERPLQFLDQQIVDELIVQMKKSGVRFLLEDRVTGLEVLRDQPHPARLKLASGEILDADLVMFSVGRKGATDALNLPAAGLAADERGRLSVDEDFRTAVGNIFAAGDVIGYPSLAATSSEQGRLAACHAFSKDACAMPQHFPFGIYAIPEISMVGEPEFKLRAQGLPIVTGVARYREIARGQILGDDSGLFKMCFHAKTRELLGVHIIGTGATELVHIGQAVMSMGGGLDYFLNTVFNYPTLAECYKVAALDAANRIGR